VRGVLTAFSQMFATFGLFLAYLLGSVITWRTAALASLSIPILTFFTIIMIPETPVWLISKGRMDEALKALCWIRGWTSPENVQQEFEEMITYQKDSVKCQYCDDSMTTCIHQSASLKDRIKYTYDMMTRKEMFRPLMMVMFLFMCIGTAAAQNIKPNMVNIYKTFRLPVDPYLATVSTYI